ncbi:MAG TPA: Na/Pi cotransporter family protein [Alphaproteobacteria bacterium]
MINIIAGVALMLWSLKLVRLGVTRGFGGHLRKTLSAGTRNPFLALLSGAGVTMFLQSSMATTMIISSFAGQAMISTAPALALILGADIGTTLVAQALAFDVSWLSPMLLLAGVVLFSMEKLGKAKNIGRILIGLGLIMLSLRLISEASAPLKHSDTLPLLLAPLQYDVFLAMLVAAIITWIAHSSLAIVLMLMTLTTAGALPLPLAMVMVLGANLGGTIAPLVATLRDSPAAMRVPAGNMLIKFTGVLIAMPLLAYYEPLLAEFSDTPARQIVNFHTAFNLTIALAFLPFTGIIAKIVTKAFPDRTDAQDPGQPRYLNVKEMDTPAIALASAARETLRMADALQGMMEDTIKAFKTNSESFINGIREKDDAIDRLYDAIKRYMARLTQEYMDKGDAQRYVQILTFATNLEHAGDVIDKNLMPLALKKIRNQGSFSTEGFREIEAIHNQVLGSIRLAQDVFVTGNIDLARRMLQEKEDIRKKEIETSISHIDRLREGVPETIATTSLHLDIIRDLRRINSYMCTVAYSLLEEKGQLNSTRLKS